MSPEQERLEAASEALQRADDAMRKAKIVKVDGKNYIDFDAAYAFGSAVIEYTKAVAARTSQGYALPPGWAKPLRPSEPQN